MAAIGVIEQVSFSRPRTHVSDQQRGIPIVEHAVQEVTRVSCIYPPFSLLLQKVGRTETEAPATARRAIRGPVVRAGWLIEPAGRRREYRWTNRAMEAGN